MALLTFSGIKSKKTINQTWKILIVDDEIDIHVLTKTVLKNFSFENKKLEFFSAYSGEEAISILKENKDIVLVLLDVIMESDDAGLDVVKKIREDLNNSLIRIILRTGHPGSAPEEEVILKYKINDYKEKTELNSKKLFTCIVSALRSYQDILTIKNHKEGLENIITASESILANTDIKLFIKESSVHLLKLINNIDNSCICLKKTIDNYEVVFATKESYNIYDDLHDDIKNTINNIDNTKISQYIDNSYVVHYNYEEETYILYIDKYDDISTLNKKLIDVLCNNIKISFHNLLLTQDIIETQKSIIECLGEVVESRSYEISLHVNRVANFSYELAKEYGLSEEDSQFLKMVSPMHDVGKIENSDDILLKPGRLSDDEYKIMKTHASIGYKILKGSKKKIIQIAAIVAYEHHERYDGTGYPRKLQKEEIHIFARITAVADVFDALYHDRCYKKTWLLEDIINLFKTERAKHFDPDLIDIVLNNIDKYEKIIK